MADETARPCDVCIRFRRVVHRDCAERIVLVKKHVAEVGAADADRILKHGGKNWLKIARRALMTWSNFRRCRLLL